MLNKEQLYDMYVVQKKTATEIGRTIGMNQRTIGVWLKKNNIQTRQRREAQMPSIPDKETLIRLYVNEKLSIDNIRKQVGSSEPSIARLLKEYGIRIRSRTEMVAGKNKGKPMSEAQKKLLSRVAKKRVGHLAPRYGTQLSDKTKKKIANSLNGRFRGPLNHQWKPDAVHKWRAMIHGQFEYKDWRRKVFSRDDYTCMSCLKPSSGDIQAHHIFPVESHPHLAFDPTNGITLCRRCHRSIRCKEMLFVELFSEIVKTRPPIP